jgi:hypothetical protein
VKESLTQKAQQHFPPQFILNAEFVSLQTQENNQGEKANQRNKRVAKKKAGGSHQIHVSSSESK